MRYVFENKNALELYYVITKEMGIDMIPGDAFKDEVFFTEDFLNKCLEGVHDKSKRHSEVPVVLSQENHVS